MRSPHSHGTYGTGKLVHYGRFLLFVNAGKIIFICSCDTHALYLSTKTSGYIVIFYFSKSVLCIHLCQFLCLIHAIAIKPVRDTC